MKLSNNIQVYLDEITIDNHTATETDIIEMAILFLYIDMYLKD